MSFLLVGMKVSEKVSFVLEGEVIGGLGGGELKLGDLGVMGVEGWELGLEARGKRW